MFELDEEESRSLRTKISTLERGGRGRYSKYNYKAFTEKGLMFILDWKVYGHTKNSHAKNDHTKHGADVAFVPLYGICPGWADS